MTIRLATDAEIDNWNKHILANPDGGNILQGYEFAMQKRMGGWTPRFIMAGDIAITALEKSTVGLGKLWYIPKGPGVKNMRQLDQLLPKIKGFAKSNGVFVVKIESEILRTKQTQSDLIKLGLIRTQPIQTSSTVLVDLSDDLDKIMAGLNQKGRHAIRRAERDGVTTDPVAASDKNCRVMYDLLAATAAGSFKIRSFNYYKTFWQRYEAAGLGQLFFAYFDGQVVAGAFAIAYGKKGTYKDGASVRERPAYGASHLLQWRIIQWMKDHGVTTHDLCGVPPSESINDPNHPHYGLGRFKTSFNKEVTDYIGTYDLPINPQQYKLWTKIVQRVTNRLRHALKRENYY